ncbi:CoaE-domain-containing protein [Penicillium digitatum]|uniref:CoaE-domain-containing protein n=1 Tax=Penicillium digitatum TaxID=36651 RepID=A0A7T7BKI9_PENDI|nr:CoaE-domain-containing protein [Penicillium digitatum]
MRQLELISNDLTSYYRSTLGDAYNASISDYRTSVAGGNLSETRIVKKGMENAVTSLVDDMLVAYALAQLMCGDHCTDCTSGNRGGPSNAVVEGSSVR